MIKKLFFLLVVILFVLSACTAASRNIPTPTGTTVSTLSQTATCAATATPIPEIDLDSFIFPYDVPQVMKIWDQIGLSNKFRYISYHIANRPDRTIPYEDSCGYHPGDQISMLHSTNFFEDFLIDVKMPYSGKLKTSWITEGDDDAFVFFVGSKDGEEVYLNSYHTTQSNISS